MTISTFKICSGCQEIWQTQDDFIKDNNLIHNGYTADFEQLDEGLFFFSHKKEHCASTIVIQVKDFLNLYHGVIHPERKTGGEECPGYCLDKENLDRCEALCECAFVREIVGIIKEKKQSS